MQTLVRRRDLSRGAAALGGAALVGRRLPTLAGADPAPGTVPLADSILGSPASECPVETIVVICMENRSFDHYYGWLGGDEAYVEAGRSRYGAGFSVDGVTDLTYLAPDGTEVPTYHLPAKPGEPNVYRGCGGHPDPGHGWESGRAQRDGGFLAPGSGNDEFAVGYFLEADLPCYGPLVRNATTFDRYFSSLMASTYPNREYLHSAQSGGQRSNDIPYATAGYDWPTIWDKLLAAGVPCRMYGTDIPTTALWSTRLLPVTTNIAEFFVEAALGLLPNVVFVDPGFLSGLRTDDHPHGDMRLGQKFVASVISAFQRSPHWDRGAVIVTYDEWGGFFDHVPPPVLPDDRLSADDAENYGQTGFRLPVTLHSPYARPGYVDHRLYDHTSILRFIEWRFLGAPAEGPVGDGWWLTVRDRNANNIGAALADQPVNEFLLDSSKVPLTLSLPCEGQIFQDVPGLEDVEDDLLTPVLQALGVNLEEVEVTVPLPVATGLIPSLPVPSLSGFDQLAASGLLESVGYSLEPSLTLEQLLGQ